MQATSGRSKHQVMFWLAIIMAVYAVISFGGVAMISEVRRTRYTPLVSAHGLMVLGWYAYLAMQARLAEAGKWELHRALGKGSALLVIALVAISGVVAINFHDDFERDGTFVADILILACFALLFGLGIVAARRRAIDWHMRFMLASAVSMLGPAHGRLVPLLGLPTAFALAVTILWTLFPMLAFDFLSQRKLHKATLFSLAILLAFLVVQVVAFLQLEGFK